MLFTLTRESSLKRPLQKTSVGDDILAKIKAVANIITNKGYSIIYNDNPKCIMTKLIKDGITYYCCLATGLTQDQKAKLSRNNVDIISISGIDVLIVDTAKQEDAQGTIYNSIGRLPIY